MTFTDDTSRTASSSISCYQYAKDLLASASDLNDKILGESLRFDADCIQPQLRTDKSSLVNLCNHTTPPQH